MEQMTAAESPSANLTNASADVDFPVDWWAAERLQRPEWRARWQPSARVSYPNVTVAGYFSVESSFVNGALSYTPVGVHKPWLYMTKEKLDALIARCPALGPLTITLRGRRAFLRSTFGWYDG